MEDVDKDKDTDDNHNNDEGKDKDNKENVDKEKSNDEGNDAVDEQDNSLRFLNGSYKERYNYWEACRLSKTMALAAISAMSPSSYCPGQKLALALAVMGLFLLGHSACSPYRNRTLNRVELRALAVLALGMVAAVWLAAESWSKTPELERAVLLGTAFVLFVTEISLIGYFLYAKFLREEEAAAGAGLGEEHAGEEEKEEEAEAEAEEEEAEPDAAAEDTRGTKGRGKDGRGKGKGRAGEESSRAYTGGGLGAEQGRGGRGEEAEAEHGGSGEPQEGGGP